MEHLLLSLLIGFCSAQITKVADFSFNEEYHSYTYKGKKLESVTTMLKRFKKSFNKEYWSVRKAEERGVDPSVILLEWEEKSKKSMDLGTRVHKFIEDFFKKAFMLKDIESNFLKRGMRYPDYNIYLATDNRQTQDIFHNKYKHRIKTIKFINPLQRQLRHSTLEDTIIDIYTCVNATFFKGSGCSSFTDLINDLRTLKNT